MFDRHRITLVAAATLAFALSMTGCFGCDEAPTEPDAEEHRASIWETEDGGATWSRYSTSLASSLTDIAEVGHTAIVALGSGGKILRTEDGGSHWNLVPNPTGQSLYSIANTGVVDNAVIVGDDETILRTSDGGVTWTSIATPPETFGALYHVSFASPAVGLACGTAGVLLTTDGGLTWSKRSSQIVNTGVIFDEREWVVMESERSYRTIDGGATYETLEDVSANHATLTPAGTIVAVGRSNVFSRSTDRGATWSQVGGILDASFDVHEMYCGWGRCIAVGERERYVSSTDDGVTWNVDLSFTGTRDLNGVLFIGDDVGYMVGGGS
jgi:photosystem II stability/assembly factor-like uncharacterized protein